MPALHGRHWAARGTKVLAKVWVPVGTVLQLGRFLAQKHDAGKYFFSIEILKGLALGLSRHTAYGVIAGRVRAQPQAQRGTGSNITFQFYVTSPGRVLTSVVAKGTRPRSPAAHGRNTRLGFFLAVRRHDDRSSVVLVGLASFE